MENSQQKAVGSQQSYKEILQAKTPYLDKKQLSRLRSLGNSQNTQGSVRNRNNLEANQSSTMSTPSTLPISHRNGNHKRLMKNIDSARVSNNDAFSRHEPQMGSTSILQAVNTAGFKPQVILKKTHKFQSSIRSKTPSFQNKDGKSVTTTAQTRTTIRPNKQKNRCQVPNSMCLTNEYKEGLCKIHFLEQLSKTFRMVVRQVYKDPESAFATFNFRGEATIGLNDILNHMVIKRIGYDKEDVQSYLLRDKIFASESSEIDYIRFKKFFFPQLMLIEDGAEGELLKQEETVLETFKDLLESNRASYNRTGGKASAASVLATSNEATQNDQENFVRDRLRKLTKFLRERFQNTWVSVRKAFLDLDVDKDGEISPEDIMRFFGDASNNLFDYFDLVKILEDLDSKGKGKLGYNDFCKWMGGAIHKSEGFYFRHDSIKNPPFEENQAKQETKYKKVESTNDLKLQLARKFEFQWKTLQSAFMHLNLGKSGKIQKWELKYFCDHWGFNMSEQQFQEIFDGLDVNQDSEIDYQEFKQAIGGILFPAENFYFRQDLKKKAMSNVCSEPNCSFVPVGYHDMCLMHHKQTRMKSMSILGMIKQKLGARWDTFMDTLKAEAVGRLDSTEKNRDGISVSLTYFVSQLQKTYGVAMTEIDQNTLVKAFGAKSEKQAVKMLNLKPILQLKNHQTMTNIYKGIQYRLDDFGDFSEEDTAGYFGTNHRMIEKHTQSFTPLKDINVLVNIMAKDFHLVKIMQTIRSIDKDKNGFVTNQELEDILKLFHKEQLCKYDLKPLFKQFASQTNRLLINYTTFKEFICEKLQGVEGVSSPLRSSIRNDRSKATSQLESSYKQNRTGDLLFRTTNGSIDSQGGAAGVTSQERKFTALDAIHGYNKFEDSNEGLIDTKFSKKMGIIGNPTAFSPKYHVKSSTISNKNMRMVSQRQKLISCNSSTELSPVNSPRGMISMRTVNDMSKNKHSNSSTIKQVSKLSGQQDTFGMLKKSNAVKKTHMISNSVERKVASGDGASVEDDRTSIHGLSQLGFFNNRKTSQVRGIIPSDINLTSNTTNGEVSQVFNKDYRQLENQQIILRKKIAKKGQSHSTLSRVAPKSILQHLDSQNTHRIKISNNDGTLSTLDLPSAMNSGIYSQKNLKLQNKDLHTREYEVGGLKNIPINSNTQKKRTHKIQEVQIKSSLPKTTSSLELDNRIIATEGIDKAIGRKQNQYLQKFHESTFSIAQGVTSTTINNQSQVNSKARLGQKLAYEWKNVFRGLKQNETFPKGQGYVTSATLERIMNDNGVKLTRHEFKMLTRLFREELQNGTTVINYMTMSKDLGLHSAKLQLMQPSLGGQSNAGGLASETRSQVSVTNLMRLRQTFNLK